ncbi:hypothetical protein [Parageobacillus thermoglucosidasius]|uniref:Uncharacterized protein n=1 Tax=Parageobacillus thermoglucosidasius TaxID=1426 RepID=A0AB38R2W3_PARTM|nr:hypothetical protein [Parageobacillus thermoglucosidasius]UOE78371.1 hypothetical protein IMI45_20255 [Parageobacillus thermoglucosidasius]
MQNFVNIILNLFKDYKTYALSLFVAAGLARIAWEGFKYKNADESERVEIKRTIRNTVVWFIGLPFCLWLADYLYDQAIKYVK